jgi:hypothetical protein
MATGDFKCGACGNYNCNCKYAPIPKISPTAPLFTGQGRFFTITDEKPDLVNHPPHYKQGRMEVIDMMLKLFGKEAVINYCELNAFKYRMRAGYKNDVAEEISKAKWYENKIKELKNDETGNDK